jgi:O-antigen ligase
VGIACLTRGLVSNHDPLLVLRDSAIVFYSAFFLVGAWFVLTWDAVRRVFLFFSIGALFATFNGLAWFIAQPAQRRYVPYGVFVLTAFLSALLFTVNKRLTPRIGWGLTSLFACGVLLANARTVYVTFFVLLLLVLWVGVPFRARASLSRLRILGSLLVVVFIVAAVSMQTETGVAFVQRTAEDLLSGTIGFADDSNARFRFEAWAEAIGRFLKNPLWGEGYGVPFSFIFADLDVRPHNTYLTILYKMGLIGFLPLAVLIGRSLIRCWGRCKAHNDQPDSLYLYCLLTTLVAMCIFGSLNLFLESPYLASIFWLLLGMTFRLTELRPAQSSTSALPRQRAKHA